MVSGIAQFSMDSCADKDLHPPPFMLPQASISSLLLPPTEGSFHSVRVSKADIFLATLQNFDNYGESPRLLKTGIETQLGGDDVRKELYD